MPTIPETLKNLRKQQPEEVLRFVYETMHDIEERLLAALPQMAEATLTSGKQATYSPTVTFRKGKKETLKVTVSARVRLPDEEKEFTFRARADGQLELYVETTPVEDPAKRKAEMDAEATGDIPEPAFNAAADEQEQEQDVPLPMTTTPAEKPTPPRASVPLTPAQERMKAIRENNLALARAGKLTPAQMEAAKITPEDLEAQAQLEDVANA